jgi:hypothetical protein
MSDVEALCFVDPWGTRTARRRMEVFAYASWLAGHASSRSRRGSEPVTPGFRLRRLEERRPSAGLVSTEARLARFVIRRSQGLLEARSEELAVEPRGQSLRLVVESGYRVGR